ncbi:putative ATP-dependent RNA helicase [Trichinella spiralis]|uniref:ATP-dependent RNA helicase n=1 Tax=Trichinella spiralis TaxID=6334 RepID=A0ABR3KD97_TRISP
MKKKLDHKKWTRAAQRSKQNKNIEKKQTEDFNTSRDDTRELALLVGREPAGRGLSSPGTALALSAASLTGAASFTTVAASLDEPAALLPRPASPCLLLSVITTTLAVELSMSTFQMWHHSVDSHIMKSLSRYPATVAVGISICVITNVIE